ncbi:serine-rich adhesin for platelets [Chelonus insularis]|uniref:serine-rich adhesin for platelets n=1 Tax=Chelonus insularis TaxID=460826 RepID=UPI00158A0025|nr:serine-rich adhesin for platelets [Chelonus insularis]XP_034941074.1 serine-rich adhesin for platelets [Chelonus insularis]XP_034941075.1 serine-rich adhesin for platelets [Chelonus insularis]
MNRREDPLLRQHCSRLLQLAETTNIKPGHGSGKRRGQKSSHGFSSGGNARITLQDIVRNDPGYTANIEHLVFPDRKGSNPNLTNQSGTSASKAKSSNSSGSNANVSTNRSRLVEVIARPYMRGSSLQDSINTKNNHFNNTSLDSGGGGGGGGSGNVGGNIPTSSSSGHQPSSGSVSSRSNQRRWHSQTSQQSSRQHSTDDGGSHVGLVGVSGNTTSSSVQQPRRVSPASDPKEIANSTTTPSVSGSRERSERTSNASILHLRGISSTDSWETGQMLNISGNRSNTYSRASSIPSLKRHETATIASGNSTIGNITSTSRNHHRRQETQSQRRRDATNSFLSGSGGTSGELFVSGNCSRELSPVRWCDREVDGVYLGRSGWVQVQQRSLDENRKNKYESNPQVTSSGNSSAVTGTIPLPRRVAVKLVDYHCSNSEPGKCPDYMGSHTLDSHRPDFLKLHSTEFEPPSGGESPHSIPESFSPPSITPIISPPPAFQDVAKRGTRSSRSMGTYGKAPFLPRSNAIIDSDVISPPPSPPPNKNRASLSLISRKISNMSGKPRLRRQANSQVSGSASSVSQSRQDNKQYRLASAKSLEDQSSTRRSQFAQRYLESSSSSSSSMGFRSLDSCVTRMTMPRLAENTDSSVEDYDDGDEEDNPDSLINSIMSNSGTTLDSSPEGKGINQDRLSPSGRQSRLSRNQQSSRKSPGSSDAGRLSFDSSSTSSTSSTSSIDRTGRSPTPNHFKRSNQSRQHQGFRNTLVLSPDSLQSSRVRRSKSLQLPEKRSPGSTNHSQQLSREHSRELNDSNRVVVKIIDDRSADRPKRHPLSTRKAKSTEETINAEVHRENEVTVTEYLYGTRSRPITRNVHSGRYENRDDTVDRRATTGPYDVYFISAKQPRHQQSIINYAQQQQQQQSSRRPRTLQRGATTPNTNTSNISSESKVRCNTSTCDFWPHCLQRETLCSPNQNQASMKLSQSYPSHRRVSTDNIISHSTRDRGSACSSPASLDVDDRESRKSRQRSERHFQTSKHEERLPKSVLKQPRRSPLGSQNELDQSTRRDFRNAHGEITGRRVSPIQSKAIGKSPSGGAVSSTTTSSSSSSDIWITTSDRTVTKSPKNPKSSGGSTPMEDAIAGSLRTLQEPQSEQLRPGSAPAKRGESPDGGKFLEPHQRSSSLPKSFLTHDTGPDGDESLQPTSSSTWHRSDGSRRSTPSPRLHPDGLPSPHTAPGSPSYNHQSIPRETLGERRRGVLGISRAQRRIKASSTPALLDHDESRQWSSDENRHANEETSRRRDLSTEHPLIEATIPLIQHSRLQDSNNPSGHGDSQSYRLKENTSQNQQESVLQKFRKSFSLRFHKRGSKEGSLEGDGQSAVPHPPSLPPENDGELSSIVRISRDEDEKDSAPMLEQHKEDYNDQKFRFGPLVWRTSKERKKNNKAARNAKCNSGDSGIQIEMVSGGALTGGSGGGSHGAGDSSESHDTDAPDETDSPPALRRRVNEKSRPQSELINQLLIDKFKTDLQQSRAVRHQNVRRTNSDLGGQRLLQWDTRGYSGQLHYRRMLSTPSPIKTRPPRLSPRHSSHDIVTLRSNARGRNSRTNLRRSLSQPLGINQLSPLMRTKTSGAKFPGGNVLSEDEQDLRSGGSGGAGGALGTSDDEMMSDSESSIVSLSERKKSFEQPMDEEIAILAEAVWDHVAIEPEELAFRAGDLIDVLDTLDKDWWWGSCRGEHGWFPAAFVRLRVSQEETVEDCLAAMASGVSSSSQSRRRTSISLLSNEQVRSSVVRELVQTERDFVKVLRDVAEGYVAECRRRTDMFTEDQIETIFINLEDLLEFQTEFLKDLEARIDWNAPHKSCVAECFLIHRNGFRMYSEYCNSHPMAIVTLQELYRHNRYSKFFEACRLMRGLIEIPLDGYLLTPVQRICKYPLQLAELLKYTKVDHPDYNKIREALDAMRAVAVLINERKRRMESLEKLAAWQLRVEGWEGEDLIEVSSQLIYQGDAVRVTTGMWTNNITLFLFDHQLVYCKKDILKRDTYVYKGRIYLDTSEVIDVPDGKDHQLGVTVRHCLKVYSCVRDKWLLFCCRSAEEKRKWLAAMAEERRLVEQDRNEGLEFPAAARQLARLAATRQQHHRPPAKPRNKTYKREAYDMSAYQPNSSNSLGRKVGTWFTFGSNKKGTRLRPS